MPRVEQCLAKIEERRREMESVDKVIGPVRPGLDFPDDEVLSALTQQMRLLSKDRSRGWLLCDSEIGRPQVRDGGIHLKTQDSSAESGLADDLKRHRDSVYRLTAEKSPCRLW